MPRLRHLLRPRPFLVAMLVLGHASAQQSPAPGTIPGTVGSQPQGTGGFRLTPMTAPEPSPGVVKLLELEGRFAEDVARGGGKAFATWFAEDAVTLNNGQAAIRGRGALAATANWDPANYSLTWSAQGAEMGAAEDMGYTWGRYVGKTKGADGKMVVTTGRYITIWKKLADGSWKVTLDASANDAPDPGACCALPQP